MATNYDQLIQERLDQLPDTILVTLNSADTAEKIRRIGLDQGLTEDQIETLQTEATLVLIGERHIDDLEISLSKLLEIPEDKAQTISTALFKDVFEDIVEEIYAVSEENEDKQLIPDEPENEEESQQTPAVISTQVPQQLKATPPANLPILDSKLGSISNSMPKQVIDLSEPELPPGKPENPVPQKPQGQSEPKPTGYNGTDPYRESLM